MANVIVGAGTSWELWGALPGRPGELEFEVLAASVIVGGLGASALDFQSRHPLGSVCIMSSMHSYQGLYYRGLSFHSTEAPPSNITTNMPLHHQR